MAAVSQFGFTRAFGINVNSNVTTYFIPGGEGPSTTESGRTVKYRTAGIFSKMQIRVATNSIATSASTVRTRVNSGNGAQSVSIAAGSTGSFQDTTNSDTIAAGDDFNLQVVTPNTSGTLVIQAANLLFAATTNSSIRLTTRDGASAESTTKYGAVSGANWNDSSDGNVALTSKATGTLSNLFTNVTSNNRSTTTLKIRKNGGNGNLSVSVTASTTGQFEDTSNSDSVAVNDTINTTYDLINSGTTVYGIVSAVDFTTTNGTSLIQQSMDSSNLAANLTRYIGIGGSGDYQTTESLTQALGLTDFTASNLACYISQNTVIGASTLQLRKNTANGNLAVSITSLTTGLFADATNSDIVLAADSINLSIITGAAGTTLDMKHSSLMFTAPGALVIASGTFIRQAVRRASSY